MTSPDAQSVSSGGGASMNQAIIDRLLAKSIREGDCIRWTGPHNHKGYGSMVFRQQRMAVHRAAYEAWIGPIPDGLEIDHVYARGCRFRDCFNPDHLEAVTHRENLLRATRLITHCPSGHEYTPENTKIRNSDGNRLCRTCIRQQAVSVRCECGVLCAPKNRARHIRRAAHQEWAARQQQEAS